MNNQKITTRRATPQDFDVLYALGKATPEFQVSADGVFMEADEFLLAIKHPKSSFIVAECGETIVGFIYAHSNDTDGPLKANWACIVYLAVRPAYRKQGIANKLYEACVEDLKASGISNVYAWAHAGDNSAIINFFKKQGFDAGHTYVWMDKKI